MSKVSFDMLNDTSARTWGGGGVGNAKYLCMAYDKTCIVYRIYTDSGNPCQFSSVRNYPRVL